MGRIPETGRKRAARLTSKSIGRCLLILDRGWLFHGSGPVRYPFHAAGLADSAARMGSGEGKFIGSLAAAGHTGEGVQANVRAAVLRLYLKRTGRGGSVPLATIIVTGVAQKQFVADLRALCQQTSSLWAIAPLGTNRSAPYKTTGRRSE